MNVIDEVVKTLTGHLAVLEAGGTPAMPLSLFLREVSTVRQASDASGTYNDSSSNMEVWMCSASMGMDFADRFCRIRP